MKGRCLEGAETISQIPNLLKSRYGQTHVRLAFMLTQNLVKMTEMTNSQATVNKDSEENKIYLAKMGSSILTFSLVFFYIAPLIYYTSLDLLEKLLTIKLDGSSSLITIIGVVLHFVFGITLSVLAIKWKNNFLSNKSLKIHWIYSIILSLLLIFFTILQHI